MVLPEIGLGARLLAYGGLVVAVPASTVLLFGVIARLNLDEHLDQYQQVSRRPGSSVEGSSPGVGDADWCPNCGECNERGFTFCRGCQAPLPS